MDKIIISEQQIREMVAQACLDAINEGAFGDKLKSFGQKAVNAAKKGYQGGKALVQKGVGVYNKGMDTLQQKIDNISSEYGFDPENNSEEEDPEDNSQETSNPQPFPDLAKAEEEYLARKQQSQQQTQPQQTQPAQGWNDSQWTSSDTTAANYQNNTTNNNEQPQQQTQSWDGNGYGEDNSIEESKKDKKTGKKVVKINESFIRQIIAECVKNVLNEIGNTPKGQYAMGRLAARKSHDTDPERTHPLNRGDWEKLIKKCYDDIETIAHPAREERRKTFEKNGKFAAKKMKNAFNKGFNSYEKEMEKKKKETEKQAEKMRKGREWWY